MAEKKVSETGALLADMTDRLLASSLNDATMRTARCGQWPDAAWRALTEQGLTHALVEGEQGFGVPLKEGLALIRLFGRYATPLPIAETMIANALLARAGLDVVEGPLALASSERVAWGRQAKALLVESGGRAGLVTSFRVIEEGSNLAGLPRDQMVMDGDPHFGTDPGITVLEAGSLIRALLMAGALQRLVELTVAHTSERVQFGKTLSSFQAVQHSLARLASEDAAASAAADLAADAFATSSPHLETAIAAARCRIGEAAGVAIGIAHQLHGAIGFTEEHRLHWYTTALWGWRDEFGTSAWWTRRLGELALSQSKQGYWPFVTAV
jgi:hypothetical protein